jgi:guanylate cyclase
MELVGREFIFFVSQYGYDRMIRVLGRHMRDFINGIDNLHEYMRFSYEKMKPPSFFVEKETSSGLILHYRTRRKGLLHYFIGQIKQVLFLNNQLKYYLMF